MNLIKKIYLNTEVGEEMITEVFESAEDTFICFFARDVSKKDTSGKFRVVVLVTVKLLMMFDDFLKDYDKHYEKVALKKEEIYDLELTERKKMQKLEKLQRRYLYWE